MHNTLKYVQAVSSSEKCTSHPHTVPACRSHTSCRHCGVLSTVGLSQWFSCILFFAVSQAQALARCYWLRSVGWPVLSWSLWEGAFHVRKPSVGTCKRLQFWVFTSQEVFCVHWLIRQVEVTLAEGSLLTVSRKWYWVRQRLQHHGLQARVWRV